MLILSKVMWSAKMVEVLTVFFEFRVVEACESQSPSTDFGCLPNSSQDSCRGCFCKGCELEKLEIYGYVDSRSSILLLFDILRLVVRVCYLYIYVYSKCCKAVQHTWDMKVGFGYAFTKVPTRGWNCLYDIWTYLDHKPDQGSCFSTQKLFLFSCEGMTIPPTINYGFKMYLYATCLYIYLYVYCIQRLIRLCGGRMSCRSQSTI